MAKTAITPKRDENFSEWYQQIIKAAELADHSCVRGCMVIKPWGYAIWEQIQKQLDQRLKEKQIVNAYFPLLIPLSFLEKEASHIEGFAKECAIVTHHRLEEKNGKLQPCGELEEPLVIRPTSETMIGYSFAQWIQSYRDLPLLINQWANVVRWEMRTRLFLRTTEFLWHEGHSAHETDKEAYDHSLDMCKLYMDFAEQVLALAPYSGEKSISERFPGAVQTHSIEMMMQDGKALQGGTSHHLGQNFSRAQNICFNARDGSLDFCYTTSWGMTTRVIGALVMTHGDDDGLRLPPMIAPYQIVIVPLIRDASDQEVIEACCLRLKKNIEKLQWQGMPVRCFVDNKEQQWGDKKWGWIKKGVPLRLEVGKREVEKGIYSLFRRDQSLKEKKEYTEQELILNVEGELNSIQESLYLYAKNYRDSMTKKDIRDFTQLKQFFLQDARGFVQAPFSNKVEHEKLLEGTKITVRCLLKSEKNVMKRCILSGEETAFEALFALAY